MISPAPNPVSISGCCSLRLLPPTAACQPEEASSSSRAPQPSRWDPKPVSGPRVSRLDAEFASCIDYTVHVRVVQLLSSGLVGFRGSSTDHHQVLQWLATRLTSVYARLQWVLVRSAGLARRGCWD